MDRAEQPSTGEYPGDASGAASWENIEESPPRPFPQRVPEFSHGERFPGMNYEHGLMNNEASLMTNENSSSLRDDDKSCFIASTTFSFLVAMTVAFGLYGSETLRLGPNTSMLITPNHLFVESVKEWIYYLNEGSQINISYSVDSLSSSSILLVIAEGNGSIQKAVSESSTYYIAVGNLNADVVKASLP
ncbi:UNVERIFIED_CONTAM: E3 ubiquitin-protein ligase APD2 [Sesamum latifolium]|uniref:E3 ubiquitin-protein ligase APD2 n=1 Tax=Sesamum latifolium TaxID=2727402 RepID=A0AAW2XAB7_9LAMI